MKRTSKIIFNTLLFLYSFSIVFGGPSSAITLLDKKNVENYLEPLGTMLTSSTNSGYFNRASTHKILGFDITLNIAYAMLPSNSRSYDFIIPDDSITYYFQFKYPKIYIVKNYSNFEQHTLLKYIADYNTQDFDWWHEEVNQDMGNPYAFIPYTNIPEDFEHDGKTIPASLLGYRITKKFVHTFCGRILSNPSSLFTEDMLKPELQDEAVFLDGIENIIETHKRVALMYFEDKSIKMACPPLEALLNIMAYGQFEGKTLADPEIRELFTPENCYGSDWYQARLITRHEVSVKLAKRLVSGIKKFLEKPEYKDECARLKMDERMAEALASLEQIKGQRSLVLFRGTLGTDPSVTAI